MKPYQPPFKRRYTKVFSSGNEMAFDFPMALLANMFPNPYPFTEWEKDRIIDILNGEMAVRHEFPVLIYDKEKGIIQATNTMGDQSFIVIRGWGHLTSQNGLGLSPEDAAKAQDEFAQDIITRLNP